MNNARTAGSSERHNQRESSRGAFLVCVYGKRTGIYPNTAYYRSYLGVLSLSIYEVYTTRVCAQFVLEYATYRGLVGGPERQAPPSLDTALRPLDPTKRNVRNSPLAAEGHRMRYYVVHHGHRPGIYDNWSVMYSVTGTKLM